MTLRLFWGLAVLVLTCGCAAATPQPRTAPSSFVLHGEVAPQLGWHVMGVTGSADAGFERAGCCGLGIYVAQKSLRGLKYSKPGSNKVNETRSNEVLEGGAELGVTIPAVQNRFRLRARLGKAGTPPEDEDLGRTGLSMSAAVIFRIWDANEPDVNELFPSVDALLGYSGLSLGREDTPAGPEDDGTFSTDALMVGIRLGAGVGIDLK